MDAISSSLPAISPLFSTAKPATDTATAGTSSTASALTNAAAAASAADASGVPSASDMVSSLQSSIDAALKNLQQQAQGPQAADNVQDFEKTVDKSTVHTAGFGTDIGLLVNNTSRLTVVSALQPNDPADFYKFRVNSSGPATLGKIGDDGVRVQVLNTYGTVMADSDENSGDAYESYKSLQQGEFNFDPGNYVLRVTRAADADSKSTPNYAIQLNQGDTYTQDYDTIAKAAQASDNPFKPPASLATLEDMLTGGSGAVSALGGGGGQSLLGMLFNGSF